MTKLGFNLLFCAVVSLGLLVHVLICEVWFFQYQAKWEGPLTWRLARRGMARGAPPLNGKPNVPCHMEAVRYNRFHPMFRSTSVGARRLLGLHLLCLRHLGYVFGLSVCRVRSSAGPDSSPAGELVTTISRERLERSR